MPDKWVSIAAAATTLNVHPRTIERRVASGKLDARRTEDGTQQVLIDLPDTPPISPATDPLETVRELAQDQVSLATGSASAIVRLAQADAERMRQELSLVRSESHRLRQGSRTAWAIVAALAVASCAAVGISTHEITWSRAELRSLHDRLGDAEQRSIDATTELHQTQRDLELAKISRAEESGKLTAYMEQANQRAAAMSDNRPTTQPTASIVERFASLFAN